MSETTETMPLPPGIRVEVLQDADLCRRYGHVVTAFDPHSQCGGVYHIARREWALYWPITLEGFAERATKIAAQLASDWEGDPEVRH